jgi:uncharacterized membrane protein
MMRLAMLVAAAVLLWPVALGAALIDRLDHHTSVASTVVYLAAARVCHQRADRSFQTRGAQWPVCARCAGVYLAGPMGLIMAFGGRRRTPRSLARIVMVAAAPTAVTWVAEVGFGLPVSALLRAASAAPLGAALTLALVSIAMPAAGSNRID